MSLKPFWRPYTALGRHLWHPKVNPSGFTSPEAFNEAAVFDHGRMGSSQAFHKHVLSWPYRVLFELSWVCYEVLDGFHKGFAVSSLLGSGRTWSGSYVLSSMSLYVTTLSFQKLP